MGPLAASPDLDGRQRADWDDGQVGRGREPSMLRARDAMDRDYALPLDVAKLSAVASVSEAHFIRTFKATFGETPHRYLQRRRVERAMYLLRASDRSVTEVCMEVGFSSLGTFSRTFREVVGETPSQFRRPRAAARRAVVLREGVDETEQFRRSLLTGSSLRSAACCRASAVPSCSSSTRTKPSTSTSEPSGSRWPPTRTSGSCAGSPCGCPAIRRGRSCSSDPVRRSWTTSPRRRSGSS